jgi:hypothetical protein
MKSILDPSFRYTPSVRTDIRKTFARIRRELGARERTEAAVEGDAKTNVLPIRQQQQRSPAAAG